VRRRMDDVADTRDEPSKSRHVLRRWGKALRFGILVARDFSFVLRAQRDQADVPPSLDVEVEIALVSSIGPSDRFDQCASFVEPPEFAFEQCGVAVLGQRLHAQCRQRRRHQAAHALAQIAYETAGDHDAPDGSRPLLGSDATVQLHVARLNDLGILITGWHRQAVLARLGRALQQPDVNEREGVAVGGTRAHAQLFGHPDDATRLALGVKASQ
jgi:hypothetical protein